MAQCIAVPGDVPGCPLTVFRNRPAGTAAPLEPSEGQIAEHCRLAFRILVFLGIRTLIVRARFTPLVLPAAIRRLDGIKAGQEFEVQRIDQGEYLLKRTKHRRNEGLVQLLLACPIKGWFQPASRTVTTDDISVPKLG